MTALPTYSFSDLKRMAKSFLDRLPGASEESREAGWKMFALAYLNTNMTEQERESEGPALFTVIWREYDEHTLH